MKKIFCLSFIAASGLLCSCSAEDVPVENDTQAIANEETFVAKKLDKDAFARAFALAWKDFHIDFTKLFAYTTPEEASEEIQKTIKSLEADAEDEMSKYPGSNAMVVSFYLDNGVGRLTEVLYINTKSNEVIGSVINDGNNNLVKTDKIKTISDNRERWTAISNFNENTADLMKYTHYEVAVGSVPTQVYAAN